MPLATILSGSKKIQRQIAVNTTVMQCLQEAGIYLDAPCGGKGHCGKCRVLCQGSLSPVGPEEAALLTSADLESGVRLACLCRIEGDAQIQVADQTEARVQTGFLGKIEPTGQKPYGAVGCAIDIGTTTIAMYFYDMNTGRLLGDRSAVNRQRAQGADVISRIHACETDPAMLGVLSNTVIEQLNTMVQDFCMTQGYDKERICDCVIAGNTTMLHLLTGLDPSGIAHAPFTPQSLFGTEYSAQQLGLCFPASVYLTPCISAYVGGDITAGMAGCSLDECDSSILFADIGTNGEMALSVDGVMTCCSTAAGPAFEGAHITHGTGSIPGAIDRVWLDDGKVCFSTIGGEAPSGICGSGLIDAVAVLLETEQLDETGFLEEDFLLDSASGICITQSDIREIQLAKSAVAAGLQCLVSRAGLQMEKVGQLLVAGGFGTHLNPVSATAIGLLPKQLSGRITAVGNASGFGASAALLNTQMKDRLENIAKCCQYIELSGDEEFQNLFVENMMFEA